MEQKEITIDARGQSLGRLASQVAVQLRGKDQADFIYHQDKGPQVTVINVDQTVLTGRKMDDKEYITYSEYPGGLKRKAAKNLTAKKRLELAVYGMLPSNKLRAGMMKRLIIK